MGLTKTEIFTSKQNHIAQIAKVLGHPARIAILENILQQDQCICGDLVTEIGLAQATISQHLKELKKIGIIQGNIEGTKVCYCIDTKKWNEIHQLFNTMFSPASLQNGTCC